MLKRFRVLLATGLLLSAGLSLGCEEVVQEDPPVPCAGEAVTAFTGVNVIPMDEERVLTGQTVKQLRRELVLAGTTAHALRRDQWVYLPVQGSGGRTERTSAANWPTR